MVTEVRKRRRGYTKLSRKLQLTIPKAAADGAGLSAGDELKVEVAGSGRLVVSLASNPIRDLARLGQELAVHYPARYLEDLREEWD
ncbi:MAG TPA: AbrB/MazE/SpoVT family DNA-binding domain-containing protein [Chloroflexota bacterium]|nr:AbrB/MazE/SpoVT family DNA-binding domain-containing protein [Chloroflexota bacterium]